MRQPLIPLLCGTAAAILVAPASALGYELGGATIEMELQLPDEDGNFAPRDPQTVTEYFNLAHCVCGETQFAVKFTLANAPDALEPQPVTLWVGTRCDDPDPSVRDMYCKQLVDQTIGDIRDLRNAPLHKIRVSDLVATNSPVCEFREVSRFVYAIIDENDDGIGEGDHAFSLEVLADTNPPPEPANLGATGGERAIVVSWDQPDTLASDVRYFQALCARADGTSNADDKFPRHDPRYWTSLLACDVDDGTTPIPPTASLPLQVADGGVSDGGIADAGPPDAGAPDGGTGGPDGGPIGPPLPGGLATLHPDYICGEAAGTETSMRIDGLENGVAYRVVLLSIDDSRNVTALDLGEHTPKPVVDGWEHYKDRGGTAEGGYCFVATATYGDYDHPFVVVLRDFRDGTLAKTAIGRALIDWYYRVSPPLADFIARHAILRAAAKVILFPLVVAAGLWEYTGLFAKLGLLIALALAVHLRRRVRARRRPARADSEPSWRGRRRRRAAIAMAAGAGALLFGISAASAQPYWDQLDEPIAEAGPAPVHWNLEFKLGPYAPAVDSEFDLGADEVGPFERMYGDGPFLMTQLALDYFFLSSRGQLGVSASLGYLSRGAGAFDVDDMGNVVVDEEGRPIRSDGDSTTFRLLPTSLSAVYRATYLDDQFGVPLVPYGKLGLAYYLWWITDPSGSISEAPTADCPNPGMTGTDCEGDKARGGSLGWQAVLGLALRAERIDPDTEVSLRNELGIEHAGFFAEILYANVDGFGSDKKLAVGDLTWFGGINFEF